MPSRAISANNPGIRGRAARPRAHRLDAWLLWLAREIRGCGLVCGSALDGRSCNRLGGRSGRRLRGACPLAMSPTLASTLRRPVSAPLATVQWDDGHTSTWSIGRMADRHGSGSPAVSRCTIRGRHWQRGPGDSTAASTTSTIGWRRLLQTDLNPDVRRRSLRPDSDGTSREGAHQVGELPDAATLRSAVPGHGSGGRAADRA